MPDVRRPTPRTHTVRPVLGRGGLALLLALAVTPYLNTLCNDPVYDDRALFTENQQVRTLDPRSLPHPSPDRCAVKWYRPLTIYSLAITYALGGLDPIAYHVGNLLSHAASVWLLSGIALTVLRRRATALVAAALFAVYAIHVEAVAPASGRTCSRCSSCFSSGGSLSTRNDGRHRDVGQWPVQPRLRVCCPRKARSWPGRPCWANSGQFS